MFNHESELEKIFLINNKGEAKEISKIRQFDDWQSRL